MYGNAQHDIQVMPDYDIMKYDLQYNTSVQLGFFLKCIINVKWNKRHAKQWFMLRVLCFAKLVLYM